jgi:outer membrane lipoprotein LolB
MSHLGSAREAGLRYRLALLLLALCVGGCASLAPVPAQVAVVPVSGDPAFELAGRLAIRQADQAVSANLRWRYDGASEEMVITGPLGAGAVEIERDATGVTLRARGRIERASDAELLMRDALGFALPLDGLRYWVRGQSGPGGRAVRIERDSQGRLASFHEAGWQVTIPSYTAVPLDALPRRIDVESSDLQVRLVIDQWTVAPVAPPAAAAPRQGVE